MKGIILFCKSRCCILKSQFNRKVGGTMYLKIVEHILHSFYAKKELFSHKGKYFVAAILAGFFIGMGMLIMGLSQSIFGGFAIGISKLINGFVFSLALSLVVMAGGELFTGNILVSSMGVLEKQCSVVQAIQICCLSYVGNFVGAGILASLFSLTGISHTPVVESLVKIAMVKAAPEFAILFGKGIFCNIMVCLAVLICGRMVSESGKLIMIFWCILPFVALGFEHSVANMTCFLVAKMFSANFTWTLMVHNLIPVTLGNIVGGILVALPYHYLGSET